MHQKRTMSQSSQFQTELKISNSFSNIENIKMNVSSFLFYLTISFGIGGAEPVTDSFILKELLKSHPYTNYNECDMLTVSADPILNIHGV